MKDLKMKKVCSVADATTKGRGQKKDFFFGGGAFSKMYKYIKWEVTSQRKLAIFFDFL